MCTVSKVMRSKVVTIPTSATVEDAMRILLDHSISGAPVVDAKGNLRGITSELLLMEVIYQPELKAAPVTRFMSTNILTVNENTLLSDAANILVSERIRRLPVVRDGHLVGIISRPDLIRYALESSDELEEFVNQAQALVR